MMPRYGLALLVLIGVAVTGVFQLKYSVVALKSELALIKADLKEERWRTRTLETDWAYLSRPDRLVALATQLELEKVDVSRLVRIEQIGRRQQLELAREPVHIVLPSGGEALFRVKPVTTFTPSSGGFHR